MFQPGAHQRISGNSHDGTDTNTVTEVLDCATVIGTDVDGGAAQQQGARSAAGKPNESGVEANSVKPQGEVGGERVQTGAGSIASWAEKAQTYVQNTVPHDSMVEDGRHHQDSELECTSRVSDGGSGVDSMVGLGDGIMRSSMLLDPCMCWIDVK